MISDYLDNWDNGMSWVTSHSLDWTSESCLGLAGQTGFTDHKLLYEKVFLLLVLQLIALQHMSHPQLLLNSCLPLLTIIQQGLLPYCSLNTRHDFLPLEL